MDDNADAFLKLVNSVLGRTIVEEDLSTSFLSLGGDSLQATNLVASVYAIWGERISVSCVLDAESLIDVMPALPRKCQAGNVAQPCIQQTSVKLPISDSQLAIYFEQLKSPRSTAYNIPIIVSVERLVSVASFEDAINKTLNKFDGLWGSFTINGGTVFFEQDDRFKRISVETFDNYDAAAETFVRPFDLAAPPLVRAGIVPFDGECTQLIIDFHHIAVDGFSIGLFVESLKNSFGDNEDSILLTPVSSYLSWLQAADYKILKEYSTRFWGPLVQAGVPRCEWAGNKSTSENQKNTYGYNVQYFKLNIDAAISAKAKALNNRTTPFSIYFLAYILTQAHCNSGAHSSTAFVLSGRSNLPMLNVVGMLAKTAVYSFDMPEYFSISKALESLRDTVKNIIENEEYDFSKVIRSISQNNTEPPIDSLFVFQNITYHRQEFLGANFRSFCEARKQSQFGQVVHLFQQESGEHEVQWEYCPERYSEYEIMYFAKVYRWYINKISQVSDDFILADIRYVDEQSEAINNFKVEELDFD